jgi:hypothetical protein
MVDQEGNGEFGGMRIGKRTELLRKKKSVQVPLCPQQIPYKLTWH